MLFLYIFPKHLNTFLAFLILYPSSSIRLFLYFLGRILINLFYGMKSERHNLGISKHFFDKTFVLYSQSILNYSILLKNYKPKLKK